MATRMTATEVSRNFSAVLTRVDAGEEIEVLRNGAPVAHIVRTPAERAVSAERLRELFGGTSRLDADFAEDVAAARRTLAPPRDPWAS